MDEADFEKRIIEHMERKGVGDPCVACGNVDWSWGYVVKFPVVGSSASWYPFFPRVCTNCGFTSWFNAFEVGFTDEEIDDMQRNGPPRETLRPEEIDQLRLEAEADQ